MFAAVILPLVGLLLGLPGIPKIPGLPGFGIKDLKKLRQGHAAPLDSLPPSWKPASRLALENQFVKAGMRPLGPGPFGLRLTQDPRQLRVSFDPDSGAVRYATQLGDVTVGTAARMPLREFTHDLTRQNFTRLWNQRTMDVLRTSALSQTTTTATGTGLKFELPSPLPKRFQGLLGPGGPSLTVNGSENIRLSGQSNWTNQQVGLLGQRRSLFPSLDMQQDLDIRLEGRLSDRVGVNLLQNSANQIPLANRIAINYKGDEDDLVQAFDLGNTNLTLPGTQYVSYSGKNEGLFGMKATTRLGPLDVTILTSKQEGRSERANYAGGSSRQNQTLYDKDYVKGVYFFLYDPSVGQSLEVQEIEDASIRLYLDDGNYLNQVNTVRGRAFVDPNNVCLDTLTCPPLADGRPDTTRSVRGTFRLLKQGADQDYEILSDVYGPQFKVIRLRSALTGDRQTLAVTYRYHHLGGIGDPIDVGGQTEDDYDAAPALRMKLLRAPLSELPSTAAGLFDPASGFAPTRELELKNFYQLSGQRIDPKTFELAIRRGDEVPPVTTVRPGVPYVQVLGLDNYDESSGFVNFNQHGHDDRVDGTAPSSNFRAFVDFERGTLFLPDPRPFAPRLARDTTGRPFDRYISSVLFRGDSLVGAADDPNEPNASIYDKRTVLAQDRLYSIDVQFTAARAGNEITLGRSNIIEGSDVVTINGQPLQRDRDYRIDYDLGRVTLIRQLGPSDQLNIDYSYAPLFQQAGRTLLGNAFRWEGRDRSFGGAFLYESKGAQDLRPRLGEEPSRVLIGDLNTEWRFKPGWVTHLVDRLPGVRTTQPSEFNVQAEMGASFPNPNTRNEIFIDDMEGVRDAVALSMGPERWRWSSIPLRTETLSQTIDDPALPRPQANAEVHWYSPLNAVKERDLKPSLSNAQGAQNTHQTLAISIPQRPPAVTDPTQPLWAGLTYPLDPVGIDLSRSQFIELWVDDFRDYHGGGPAPRVRGHNVKLHVDLGVVPEDQQRAPNIPPNNKLDTEDRPPRDNQLTVVEGNNEDTGLDGQLDALETSATATPDLVTVTGVDPQGDDFALPNSAFKDWDPRKWLFTNGTEDNKNVTPVPDTEDLNLNNALDTQNSYFEYTIDLGDSTSRYLVSDVYSSYTSYANDGAPVPADNGWRRYRIPIADSLRTRFGSPDLTLARHVRVWLEDIVETDDINPPARPADDWRPFVALGGLEIVGSRWFAATLDSASRAAGTTLTLNTVNTIDHADIYAPPFDPGQTRSGSQELARREQSMALEFTALARDTLEVYKTFSLDENYSRYGKLDWFAAGFDIPGYDEAADSLDYFLRFASDERGTNYYEYRARVPRSSSPGQIHWQEVTLALTDLSNLKLKPNFPTSGDIYYSTDSTAYPRYTIKGRPSFTRLRRISFGIINASGKTFPSGQVWLDEVRATDVAKDRGRAQRVNVNGRLANLMSYNLSWNGRDADFQSVGETRGSGNSSDQFGFQTSVELHRFFESTRIVLPFSFGYAGSRSSPRFTAGDDVIRTGALAEASDTRATSRNWSLSYSRTWNDRGNPFLRYTLGGITASMSRTQSDNRNPVTVGNSRSQQAAVNYSIAPRQLFSLPVPGTRFKLFPLPERLYWNYGVQTLTSETFDRRRDAGGSLVPRTSNQGRNADISFGADSRPLDFFHHSFQGRRNLMLPTPLLERVGFINFGRVVNWGQSMDARFTTQKYGPWMRPNLSWRTNYRQNNGPELSPDLRVLAVDNQQQITLDWDLPFDRLAPRTAGVPRDSLKRRGPGGLRQWLSRLGPLSTDAAFNATSGHSRLTGSPSLLYLLGLSRDPGLSGDSTGRVHASFGNRSTDNVEWRFGSRTTLDLGLGVMVLARGDMSIQRSTANSVENRSNRIHFPDLDVTYGRAADFVGLSRLLVSPQIKTRYNRSQSVDYANSDRATGVSTSSEWRPLIQISGDLKNGTRTQLAVERRITQSENRLNGNSITTDRNTNVNLSLNRSYSKGQKVNLLGKEATIKSSVNLGLSAAYERQSGETVQQQFALPQNQTKKDRLSVNAQGGYWFSNNVTGNLELGFAQNRDLVRGAITRNVRVELRAQFTF